MTEKGKTTLRVVVSVLFGTMIVLAVGYILVYYSVLKLGVGGTGDWGYNLLPKNYEISRSSQYRITLCENNSGRLSTVLEPCIIAFCSNENYIALKRISGWAGQPFTENSVEYYIVDAERKDIIGPLDEDGYYLKTKELEISFEQWIQTDKRPNGAID